jgi:cell division septum initiation protein DivIVA
MADHEEPGGDPEFGVRALGYSRRQVDEFVAEVRRELRGLHPGPDQAPGEPGRMFPEPVSDQVSRLLRFAQEEAATRVAAARQQAERTLLSAREVADRLMADARKRSAELEEKVAAALEREVAARVDELTHKHERLLTGLTGMRDSLVEALDHDAMLGPIQTPYEDLAGDTVRVYQPQSGARAVEQGDWQDWRAG